MAALGHGGVDRAGGDTRGRKHPAAAVGMDRRGARAWMLLWGAAAAALYLAAGAYVWTRVPVRLLYEGEAPPPPYRWVRPPANLPEPNQPPESGTGTIPLTPAGSQSASVLTDD